MRTHPEGAHEGALEFGAPELTRPPCIANLRFQTTSRPKDALSPVRS